MPGTRFRFNLQELGGALGDLGTLLPLVITLITVNGMNAASVLLVVGLAYVTAGRFYRLPMPVQPLKAVAAIAIAGGLSPGVISAAGLLMAAFLLLAAKTGIINNVGKLFSKAVVRGMQLGIGLILVKTGLLMVSKEQVVIGGGHGVTTLVNLSVPTGWLIALGSGAVFLLFLGSKRFPASLVLLTMGIPIGIFWGSLLALPSLRFGLSLPVFSFPSLADLSTALILLVIPQIPLTLGNSVFATVDTARNYFGPQANKVTPKALLTTMGIANLGAGLLGGMPVCHGSGGLTAHVRLGARTGGAAILIGIPLVLMALFLDGNVVPIFSLIPYSVLGVLVIFVGAQHSLFVRDLKYKKEIAVALAVAVPGVLVSNLAIGLASGIALHLVLQTIAQKDRVWSRLMAVVAKEA